MRKYRLCVCKQFHKCASSDGDWDGTWYESYEWIIYDDAGIEVAGMDGYRSEEAARKTGEERLKRLEERL